MVKLDRREQFMAMIARFRKFIVTVAGFIATAAASASDGHVVPSKYMPYVVIFLGICTSYGVYQVRNAPSTPSHEPQPEPMPEPVPMPEPQPEVVIPEPEYPTSSQ